MTGWGMSAHPFVPVAAGGVDVLMVSNYTNLGPLPEKLFEQLQGYTTCHLVAWSMGVWMSGYLLKEFDEIFTLKMAIGGTLNPVHKTQGIPPLSYDAIAGNFTATTLEAFYSSMFTDEEEKQLFFKHQPPRIMDKLLTELNGFKEHYTNHKAAPDIFTHKIITSRDRVFPCKNQIRAWGKKHSTILKLPHFPFYALGNWNALLQLAD